MDQNDQEIRLLNNAPGELISKYQGLIKGIVYKYKKGGYVATREINDLIQEINRTLLERIGKIQKQYNGRSSLRTYISVIVKNICREKFRKLSILEEPQAPDYLKLEGGQPALDNLLIREEYERLQKVIRLMFGKGLRFMVIFKFICAMRIVKKDIMAINNEIPDSDLDRIIEDLNSKNQEGTTKKVKFEILSDILKQIEGSYTSPDSLRKWYTSRSEECIDLMNGHPPRSSYTIETLQILIEKYEILKIVD